MVWCGATAWHTPVVAGALHAIQAGRGLCRMEVGALGVVLVRRLTEQPTPGAEQEETPLVAFRLETAARVS